MLVFSSILLGLHFALFMACFMFCLRLNLSKKSNKIAILPCIISILSIVASAIIVFFNIDEELRSGEFFCAHSFLVSSIICFELACIVPIFKTRNKFIYFACLCFISVLLFNISLSCGFVESAKDLDVPILLEGKKWYKILAFVISNTFQAFTLDLSYEYLFIYEYSSIYKWVGIIFANLVTFISPAIGGFTIVAMIGRFVPKVKLGLASLYKKNIYIFSELNERSIVIAESIAKKAKDILTLSRKDKKESKEYKKYKNYCIVFTDTYVNSSDENISEILGRAQNIRAICLKDDVKNLKVHFKRFIIMSRNFYFFFMDNDGNNVDDLNDLIQFDEKAKKLKIEKNYATKFDNAFVYIIPNKYNVETKVETIRDKMRQMLKKEIRNIKVVYPVDQNIYDTIQENYEVQKYSKSEHNYVVVGSSTECNKFIEIIHYYELIKNVSFPSRFIVFTKNEEKHKNQFSYNFTKKMQTLVEYNKFNTNSFLFQEELKQTQKLLGTIGFFISLGNDDLNDDIYNCIKITMNCPEIKCETNFDPKCYVSRKDGLGEYNSNDDNRIYLIKTKDVYSIDSINDKLNHSQESINDDFNHYQDIIDIIYKDGKIIRGQVQNQMVNNFMAEIKISSDVKILSNNLFENYVKLRKITIPESVTEIGDNVFFGCSSLESITIPKSVTKIGCGAFFGCSSLESITIPKSVNSIGINAFFGCSNLTNLKIHEGVTSIGNESFGGCISLKAIDIPEGVTSISSYAFYMCVSLTSVTIPQSVKIIEAGSFYGCRELIDLKIMGSVTRIGDNAFGGCCSLKNVAIPESVISIGSGAFFGCGSLADIIIPKGVTTIEECAFENCSSLESIIIPKSVTRIGWSAFENCSNLKNLIIPKGVTTIEECAFENCSSLESIIIPKSVTRIGWNAFKNCSNLKNLIILKGITTIEECAFENCSSLESIIIPESVLILDDDVFSGCFNLKDVYYLGTPEQWNKLGYEFGSNCTIHFENEDTKKKRRNSKNE